MKRRIFLVGGSVAFAQQVKLGGSVLGYFADAEGHVRALVGLPGSAYWSEPLSSEIVVTQVAGAYALDADGGVYYLEGIDGMSLVASGAQRLTASGRGDTAVAHRGNELQILRSGATLGRIATEAATAAVSEDGRMVAVADGASVAVYGSDGAAVCQAAVADVRSLQLLRDGVYALAGELVRIDLSGNVERLGGGGQELYASADGGRLLAVDGVAGQMFTVGTRVWASVALPMAAKRVASLRGGRAFLLTGPAEEPGWTIDFSPDETRLAQVPMARGGRL